MGEIWVRIADACDNCQASGGEFGRQEAELGVQADLAVEIDRVGHRQVASEVEIAVVAVRNDGVEGVVAAAHLDHHECAVRPELEPTRGRSCGGTSGITAPDADAVRARRGHCDGRPQRREEMPARNGWACAQL